MKFRKKRMRSNRGGIDSGERLYRLESHFEKGFVKGEKGGSMWAKSQVMRLNISEGVGHLKWEWEKSLRSVRSSSLDHPF